MTTNPGRAVTVMRAKLGADDPGVDLDVDEYELVTDVDATTLLEMSDTIRLLGASEYSDHQHEKLLRRNLILAREVGGVADAVDDREAAEDLVRYINTAKNDSPETNKDYRVALRQLGAIITEGDDLPESVEWIPGGYPSNYDPAPDPAEMLTWADDIQPMLEACMNSRDRALVALAFDLGPRPGELFDLTPGAITDHKYGKQITVDGKRGRRSPVLVPSVPYVRRWLDDHPGGDTDALWCGLKSSSAVSNNRIRDALKEIADRAGVDKPVTPTNFRKSSASFLASQGVSQAHLEDHHGWTRGSDTASRYIAVFDDANEREIAQAHGLDVSEDEPESTGPVVCPRCEQKTPREKDVCVWCDQALSQAAADELDELDTEVAESIAEADDIPDDVDADDVLELYRTVSGDSALKRVLGLEG